MTERTRTIASLALLFVLGVVSSAARIDHVADTTWIGPLDCGAYANQGRALAEGDGFNIRYISSFYIPYPPEAYRPDDHWPPAIAFVLAAWFKVFGPTVWAARAAAITVGCIFMPMAAAVLAWAISSRWWPTLLTGLLVLACPEYVRASLLPGADLLLGGFLALFFAGLIRGGRGFLAAGLMAGACWYAKPTGVALALMIPLLGATLHGVAVLRTRMLWSGVLAMLLVCLPFGVAKTAQYGSPFATTQNYAGAHVGLDDWTVRHHSVYWGVDTPTLADRLRKDPAELAARISINARTWITMSLAGWRLPTERFQVGADDMVPAFHPGQPWRNMDAGSLAIDSPTPPTLFRWSPEIALVHIPTLFALLALALSGIRRFREGAQDDERLALASLVLLASQSVPIILIWTVVWRYAYPSMVLLTAIGLGLLGRRWQPPRPAVAALSVALALLPLWTVERAILPDLAPDPDPAIEVADWLSAEHPEGTVFMARPVMRVLFHGEARHKGITLPYTEDPNILLGIARHYKVQYLLDSDEFPSVDLLREAYPRALRRTDGPRRLWKLYWPHVPDDAPRLPGEP